jgi:hypothetical protein
MTTVVATRDRIVCDSKATHGDTSYHTKKVEEFRGSLLGVCGDTEQLGLFMRWYKGGRKPSKIPVINGEAEFTVLVLSKRGLQIYVNTFEPDQVTDLHYAIGTGAHAALAAMACGKSPEQAVEIACRIDTNSGPPIQTFLLADASAPQRRKG